MNPQSSPAVESDDLDFVLTRVLDAPRTLVFQAWTDPRHVTHWWGPKGFSNPVCEMDVRPGGAHRVVMRSSDGVDYPITGFYQEVVPPGAGRDDHGLHRPSTSMARRDHAESTAR